MIGYENVEERLHRALELSAAEATEVVFQSNNSALTRFANNYIHQNVAEANATLTLKAVVGKQAGSATTNDLSDEGLEKVAERALAHAKSSPADPDLPDLPMPQTVIPATAYDLETDEIGPGVRASAVGRVCQIAKEKSLDAFGAFRTMSSETAVANSSGLFVYHPATTADFLVSVSGPAGSGRAQESAWNISDINPYEVGMEAINKAILAQNPRAIDPAKYTVVLEPYAVQDLILMLNFTGMGAQAVQEGYSWMNGRIGDQIMSPLVSIWDDGIDPAGLPMPFDFEGVPRQRVEIVEKGWLKGPVYDTYTANKEGKTSTGHAIPPNIMFFDGPLAQNLLMATGKSSVDEMIQETEFGLYITRFFYTRPVHPRDCVVTGMTRDGVFLIENGQLTKPVKDLRFTQSYLEAMADISAIGRERKTLIGELGGSVCVPAVKIDSFNFTGLTV